MILLQALLVGIVGYSIGMGMTAVFFAITSRQEATRGIVLLWQVMAASGGVVLFIVAVAILMSVRRVLKLEPAIVFRGKLMEHAVRARGITKWFGQSEARVRALRRLEMDIGMGELAMLVGPSGCGKTTLISVIAGLFDASEGELEVLDERPGQMKAKQRILFRRRNLGFVFQQFNLLPALTAAENVAVPLFIAGWKRRAAVDKGGRSARRFGHGRSRPRAAFAAIGRPAAARRHGPSAGA